MTVKTVTGTSKSDLDEIKTTVGKTSTVGASYEMRGVLYQVQSKMAHFRRSF